MMSAFSEILVLVVGDAMLDRYFDGAVEAAHGGKVVVLAALADGDLAPLAEEARPTGAPASQ